MTINIEIGNYFLTQQTLYLLREIKQKTYFNITLVLSVNCFLHQYLNYWQPQLILQCLLLLRFSVTAVPNLLCNNLHHNVAFACPVAKYHRITLLRYSFTIYYCHLMVRNTSVSYTHLDVYKRQV